MDSFCRVRSAASLHRTTPLQLIGPAGFADRVEHELRAYTLNLLDAQSVDVVIIAAESSGDGFDRVANSATVKPSGDEICRRSGYRRACSSTRTNFGSTALCSITASQHPASPEVNTVMASNVGRSNTTMTDAMYSSDVAGRVTLPLLRCRDIKLRRTN